MSVNVGLWKVLASSVLATSGVVTAGLVAVPVLVPATSSPAPVATAPPVPTAQSGVSTTSTGWTSAADQYAVTRAERALRTRAEEMVSASPWGEVEWLSGGTHAVRATLAPTGVPTVKQQHEVARTAAKVEAAVTKSRRSAPERTVAASKADTSPVSGSAPDSPSDAATDPVDSNGNLGNSTGDGSGNGSGNGSGQPTTPTTTTETTPTPPPASTPEPPKSDTALRLVQANIKTSMDNGRWFADYARVKALKPDFITLNEASTRTDEALAAGGYGIHRAHSDSSTKETPVLWRLDTWTEVASGTRYLTTRRVKWGVRAVNWVTAKNLHTGQVVSVISAHPAPTIPVTRGLLPEFMQGLAALTRELADKGPVFIGGDLNVHYQSDPYPRTALASAGLQPTFDTLGRMPTGDHGAIIDYMLFQPHQGVTAIRQGKVEQNSDHHTLWADFALPR